MYSVCWENDEKLAFFGITGHLCFATVLCQCYCLLGTISPVLRVLSQAAKKQAQKAKASPMQLAFHSNGQQMEVDKQVNRVIMQFHDAGSRRFACTKCDNRD